MKDGSAATSVGQLRFWSNQTKAQTEEKVFRANLPILGLGGAGGPKGSMGWGVGGEVVGRVGWWGVR